MSIPILMQRAETKASIARDIVCKFLLSLGAGATAALILGGIIWRLMGADPHQNDPFIFVFLVFSIPTFWGLMRPDIR